jgi:hypothetical protein
MRVMRINEDPVDPHAELVGAQEAVGFDHFVPAVDLFRLGGVQPEAPIGQSSLPLSSQASRGYCPCPILSGSGGAVPYVQRIGDFMATMATHDPKPTLKTH